MPILCRSDGALKKRIYAVLFRFRSYGAESITLTQTGIRFDLLYPIQQTRMGYTKTGDGFNAKSCFNDEAKKFK
jgi:hypothetical protein